MTGNAVIGNVKTRPGRRSHGGARGAGQLVARIIAASIFSAAGAAQIAKFAIFARLLLPAAFPRKRHGAQTLLACPLTRSSCI